MPINISCPLCEKAIHVSSSAAGRNVRCPDCHASVAVPGAGDGKFRLTKVGRQKLLLIVAITVVCGILVIVGWMHLSK